MAHSCAIFFCLKFVNSPLSAPEIHLGKAMPIPRHHPVFHSRIDQ
jgi:hypothetical protein